MSQANQQVERTKVSLEEVSRAEPGEKGYSPPAEVVPLPSKGLLYPADHPFHNTDRIEIKAMTATEEDILTSRALLKQGKAIGALLKSCLVDRRVNPDTLLSGDRNAILIAIRITGYGAEYKAAVECQACGKVDKNWSFNLSTLEVKPLGGTPLAAFQNLFGMNLPSGRPCTFRLLTEADETDLNKTIENSRKVLGGHIDNSTTLRLQAQLVSIGNESDRSKLAGLVRSMPARDSLALRQRIVEVSPGVEMRQTFTCKDPDCNEEQEVDVPMGTEFFWPRTR